MNTCIKRFAERQNKSGVYEVVIFADALGEPYPTRLGPFSQSNPPSSTEFPDWPTLFAAVNVSRNCVENAVFNPTTNVKDLCELLPNGTEVNFCRVITTTYDADGIPTNTVNDFENDLTTPFVVTDESNVSARPSKVTQHTTHHTKCLCDDVDGNGTNFVSFVEFYKIVVGVDGSTDSQLVGTFTDETLATPYTPTNPVDCHDIGTDPVEQWNVLDITGTQTWSPPFLINALSVFVLQGNPIYTGSDGVSVTMETGQSTSFSIDGSGNLVDNSNIIIDANGGTVKISYSTLA